MFRWAGESCPSKHPYLLGLTQLNEFAGAPRLQIHSTFLVFRVRCVSPTCLGLRQKLDKEMLL